MEIAIDFDGTCVSHEFPEVGKEVGSVRVLKRLIEENHNLILFTMRSGSELTDAVKWFLVNDIPLYGIQYNPTQTQWTSSNKCYAQLYIDDAALGAPLKREEGISRPFIDWEAVENILEMDGILKPTCEFMQALREDTIQSEKEWNDKQK